MLSSRLSGRFFSSSSRCFSRLSLSSTDNRLSRRFPKKIEPPEESLGLDPMTVEIQHLWTLRKYYSDGDVKNSLLNDNSFRGTCSLIMKKLRYIRPEQVRSLAHLVLGINLPTNIGITKGALQMLRVHLNEYDSIQLSEIYFLLSQNPMVERDPEDEREPIDPTLKALLSAIPEALAIKILGKKLTTRPDHLLLILKASTHGSIDLKAVSFLLQVIASKLRFMNSAHLNNLVGLLSHSYIEENLDSIGRPLINKILNHCFTQIVGSLSSYNFEIDYYFDETLKSLSTTSDPVYFNRKYCDTIYSIYEKSDSFENYGAFDYFLAFTMKYDHYSSNALEKVSSLIVNNSRSFLWDVPLSSANIIQILGHLNWRPTNVNWKDLFPILLEEIKLHGSHFYSPMSTLISFLILKEHEAFEHLIETQPNLIEDNLKFSSLEKSYNNLLTLNIGISCEANDLTSSTIKSSLSSILPQAINHLNSIHKPNQFQESLSSFLRLTFGGKQKVITNVWTSNGHFINNLLMVNRDGKLIDLDNYDNEDQNGIKLLDDCYKFNSENTL